MTRGGHSVLQRIVARRLADVEAAYGRLDRSCLARMAATGRPPRDFAAELMAGSEVAVIAEVKKASPSAGPIAPGSDAASQARRYLAGGAAAVSVLAESPHFGGSFDDVAQVCDVIAAPVLCKDFVVGEAQLHVARAAGADAVLLMVSVLGTGVAAYLDAARALGMQSLVEVVDARELDVALAAGATLVGVNSRDLHTLSVRVSDALGVVSEAARAGVRVVLASGVTSRDDVAAAAAAGADAVLVGETLMRASDPRAAVAALATVPRRPAVGEVRGL